MALGGGGGPKSLRSAAPQGSRILQRPHNWEVLDPEPLMPLSTFPHCSLLCL